MQLPRYMNARQLAGYIAAVELEDHQNPDPEIMRFTSWARAEHRWAHDYDAFNAHLATNMEQYIIKLPPGVRFLLDSASLCAIVDYLFLGVGLLLGLSLEGASLPPNSTPLNSFQPQPTSNPNPNPTPTRPRMLRTSTSWMTSCCWQTRRRPAAPTAVARGRRLTAARGRRRGWTSGWWGCCLGAGRG